MNNKNFYELNLSRQMLDSIDEMGFSTASPIQSEAIPLILDGLDIIGQAQTGTGKTAAYAIPVIEKLSNEVKKLQAIVLCPTRELVVQVAAEFKKLMKNSHGLSVVPIYGGQQIEKQFAALKKHPQVVIGTPGRVMDHLRRGSMDLTGLQFAVLDEADEMLDMGFREDIEIILKDAPKNRQTVLFSATMPADIIALTRKYQNNPTLVNVTNQKISTPKINQVYFQIQEKNKSELLVRLIDIHNIRLGLVFCNTKRQVDDLVEILKTKGYFADSLHGDLSQNARDKVMAGFRNGTVEILVATDVAGRGLDVNNVEAVFNFDLPRDDEDYIHRIGRTARAGKTGQAFTFVTGKQLHIIKKIERINGFHIPKQNVPTIDEIETIKTDSCATKVADIVKTGNLDKYKDRIDYIMSAGISAKDVAAALLMMLSSTAKSDFDESINFEDTSDSKDYSTGEHNKKFFHKRRFGKSSDKNYSKSGRKSKSYGNKPEGKFSSGKKSTRKGAKKSFK